MDVNVFVGKDYENEPRFEGLKTKPISNCVVRIAYIVIWKNKANQPGQARMSWAESKDLKKQSQVAGGELDVTTDIRKDYMDILRFQRRKNKANQSQLADSR